MLTHHFTQGRHAADSTSVLQSDWLAGPLPGVLSQPTGARVELSPGDVDPRGLHRAINRLRCLHRRTLALHTCRSVIDLR